LKRKDSVFENISDALINAFSKVKRPEERFINLSLNTAKFETHLKNIEKSQQGMIKHFEDLNEENKEFITSYSNLAHLEQGLFEPLQQLVKVYEGLTKSGKRFNDQLDINCQGLVKDYIQYCRNAKVRSEMFYYAVHFENKRPKTT
jgi:sorting nexin-4